MGLPTLFRSYKKGATSGVIRKAIKKDDAQNNRYIFIVGSALLNCIQTYSVYTFCVSLHDLRIIYGKQGN